LKKTKFWLEFFDAKIARTNTGLLVTFVDRMDRHPISVCYQCLIKFRQVVNIPLAVFWQYEPVDPGKNFKKRFWKHHK